MLFHTVDELLPYVICALQQGEKQVVWSLKCFTFKFKYKGAKCCSYFNSFICVGANCILFKFQNSPKCTFLTDLVL